MTAPNVTALMQELRDLKAGIPSHQHYDTKGNPWRCTSPYCERGNDVRDEPEPAPGRDKLSAAQYRRVYA